MVALRRLLLPLLLLGLAGLAAGLRLRTLPVASALGDAMGPWWVAARGDLLATPHAPPYGWALVLPYRACLAVAHSLWEAVGGLLLLHGVVAPLAALLAWRLRPGAWAAAGVAGLAAAVDPNLLDTATSGAEGYLGAAWVGLLAVAVTSPLRPWAGPLAGLAFAMAVMNHPLAACAAPLLLLLPLRARGTGLGALVAAVLLAPRLVRLLHAPLPGGGGVDSASFVALDAWWTQGGTVAALVAVGLLAGLVGPRTRPLAVATLGSMALLLLAGGALGYLRDYHLRLLTVPALAGLAGLPGWTAALGLLLLRVPADPVTRPAQALRPGTQGLTWALGSALRSVPERPLVVDGAWLSGSPAAEAGALMLDLHLRGEPASALAPGGVVAVLVSAERADLAAVPWRGARLAPGDRHFLLVDSPAVVRAWSAELCATRAAAGAAPPRLGGAWDGLAMLHPGMDAAAAADWWDCPEGLR